MLERLRSILVSSFIGAITLGWVFAQAILHRSGSHSENLDASRSNPAAGWRPASERPALGAGSEQTGSDEIAIHPRDRVDADLLRTRLLTLAEERAAAEVLEIHLLDHRAARGGSARAVPAAGGRGG